MKKSKLAKPAKAYAATKGAKATPTKKGLTKGGAAKGSKVKSM